MSRITKKMLELRTENLNAIIKPTKAILFVENRNNYWAVDLGRINENGNYTVERNLEAGLTTREAWQYLCAIGCGTQILKGFSYSESNKIKAVK